MNKSQLIDALAQDVELPKKDIATLVDAYGARVAQALAEGEATLPGLGKLRLAERSAREGRNPKTGEVIQIAAKTTVKFSPGKALEDALNS